MDDAKFILGFEAVEVYASTLMVNARKVEKALQLRYQHLPLGLRLWRHADTGLFMHVSRMNYDRLA